MLLACTWWLNEQGERPSQIALATQAGTDIKMTSQVVRSLERKGLIEREIDTADTRARRLRVTGRGKRLAPRAIAVVEQVDSDFFSDLPGPRRCGSFAAWWSCLPCGRISVGRMHPERPFWVNKRRGRDLNPRRT